MASLVNNFARQLRQCNFSCCYHFCVESMQRHINYRLLSGKSYVYFHWEKFHIREKLKMIYCSHYTNALLMANAVFTFLLNITTYLSTRWSSFLQNKNSDTYFNKTCGSIYVCFNWFFSITFKKSWVLKITLLLSPSWAHLASFVAGKFTFENLTSNC